MYALAVDGLVSTKEQLDALNAGTDVAIQRALNFAADRARTLAAQMIGAEVNLGTDYLSPSNGKLFVSKRAGAGSLEAAITGKQRAISLARFTGGGKPGTTGMTVRVKTNGGGKVMKKAFFMKLKSGSTMSDTIYNLGLAVRSKTPLSHSHGAKLIGKDLYLLYGPSVDQVFKSVMVDPRLQNAAALDFMTELDRQMRLSQ